MTRKTNLARSFLAVGALALVLTGCGGGEESPAKADKTSSTTSSKPAESEDSSGTLSDKCSEIWVEGKTLPDGYDGCTDDSGEEQAYAEYGECTDGRQFMGNEPDGEQAYYAGLGGKIFAGDKDDDSWYTKLSECTGE